MKAQAVDGSWFRTSGSLALHASPPGHARLPPIRPSPDPGPHNADASRSCRYLLHRSGILIYAKTGKRARDSRCRLLPKSADTLRWGADRRLTSARHQSIVLYGSPATLVLGLQRTIVAPASIPVPAHSAPVSLLVFAGHRPRRVTRSGMDGSPRPRLGCRPHLPLPSLLAHHVPAPVHDPA